MCEICDLNSEEQYIFVIIINIAIYEWKAFKQNELLFSGS